jgi:plastocyanin
VIRVLTIAAICAVAAVVSACGSDNSGGSGGSGPPTISMHDLRFHPAHVSVKVGQRVTWTNDDTVDHNVTAKSGAKFMSQAFGGGGKYTYTPRSPGTITYVCTLHPGMNGTLVVK